MHNYTELDFLTCNIDHVLTAIDPRSSADPAEYSFYWPKLHTVACQRLTGRWISSNCTPKFPWYKALDIRSTGLQL